METDPLIGKVINNYRITAEINSGAFGSVYRAEHLYLKRRTAAIKFLHIHLKSSKEREQFAQEAQILSELKHPHILPLTDFGFSNGQSYMIADYAAGGSLHNLLQRQSPLPIVKALTILEQVGQALQHAHSHNIIHRDLKPANILFDAQGQVLLADFGIASILAASVKQSSIAGTPLYMAPEQFRGTVSKEGDQYALACIAYELLTGRLPFEAPDFFSMGYQHQYEQPVPPSHINAEVRPDAEAALLKAMAKQRTKRHSSVEAFVLALRKPFPFLQTTVIVQPPSGKTKEEWIRIGKEHIKAKRHNKALIACDLPLDPNFVLTYNNNKGLTLDDLKRYDEALTAFEQAIHLDPNFALAYNCKGEVLYHLKRYDEALAACEQAVRLDPNFALAYNCKGNTLFYLKRYEEALAAYDQAIRLDPNYALAYNNKGVVLYNLKRYQEALVAYDQAIHLDPTITLYYYNKGGTLDELNRYEEALAACDQALRLDSNFALAYLGKGMILSNLKRYNEALAACDQALHLDPNFALAYFCKGAILSNHERYDEALIAYDQALRLDSNFALAYLGKGMILSNLKRYDEALAAYEQALRLDPNSKIAYNNKGHTLYNLKRYDEALAACDQALRLDPNDANTYNGKGNALYNLKRYDEALIAYNQAICLDPYDADTYINKGDILKRLGRHQEAKQAYQQAKKCTK